MSSIAFLVVEMYQHSLTPKITGAATHLHPVAVALSREKAEEKKGQLTPPANTEFRHHLDYLIEEVELVE